MTRWASFVLKRISSSPKPDFRTAKGFDTAKRYEYYQRCEQILAEECPVAPIYFYMHNNLRRPEVKGWYGNLLDNHPLKGVYLETANGTN